MIALQALCVDSLQYLTYFLFTVYLFYTIFYSQYLKIYSISSVTFWNVVRKTMKTYVVITSIPAKNET